VDLRLRIRSRQCCIEGATTQVRPTNACWSNCAITVVFVVSLGGCANRVVSHVGGHWCIGAKPSSHMESMIARLECDHIVTGVPTGGAFATKNEHAMGKIIEVVHGQGRDNDRRIGITEIVVDGKLEVVH
jgi:hypothetical protein